MPNDQNDDGNMTVREAGHKGGEQTSKEFGREHYQEIGKKGGDVGGPRVRDLVEKGKEAENGGE